MSSKEEINRVNEILSCDNCPTSYACEGCDITQNDKLLIKKYIANLQQENKKQNKIIDEMAKAYMKVTSEKYRIKNICEKGKCQNEECHEDDWTKCIKNILKRKVEKK